MILESLKSIFKTGTKLTGTLILISACVVIYIDWDIFRETFAGRSASEISYTDLILPLVMFIIGFYLIFKKKNNESKAP